MDLTLKYILLRRRCKYHQCHCEAFGSLQNFCRNFRLWKFLQINGHWLMHLKDKQTEKVIFIITHMAYCLKTILGFFASNALLKCLEGLLKVATILLEKWCNQFLVVQYL